MAETAALTGSLTTPIWSTHEQARPQAPLPQGQRRQPRPQAQRLSRVLHARPPFPPGSGGFLRAPHPHRIRASTGRTPACNRRGMPRGDHAAYVARLVALLSKLDSDVDGGDAGHDLHPQLRRRDLTTARASHQRLERLVEVILLQARATMLQVLTDLDAVIRAHLAVEVLVELKPRAGAVELVVLSAGHEVASSTTKPRSRA